MEKTKNQKFILAFVAFVAVIVMSVVVITSFATAKPVLAEEDYGIEPYFCNNRTETIFVGGEEFSCKLEGKDMLWPFSDTLNVTITSVNNQIFKYNVEIIMFYHLGGSNPENSNVRDVAQWNGTRFKTVSFEMKGQDHNYGGEKYHKYDVIRARINITIIYKSVEVTKSYDLLYHQ